MSDARVDKLVSMYLNKSGKTNAQFTRQFQTMPPEVQEAILAKIEERGLKPYKYVPRKPKAKVEAKPVAKSSMKEMITQLLVEINKEIADLEEHLRVLYIVRDYYTKKLAGTGLEVEISFVRSDSGSAGAARQQKADSIGPAVSTTASCDTCSDVASGAPSIPEA